MDHPQAKKPLRVGVFDSFDQSEQAVKNLLQMGFTKNDITIVIPHESTSKFQNFEKQDPSGLKHFFAGAAGGTVGSILGALAAVGVVTTSGAALLAVGPLLAGTGALVGSFVGLMMREGVEKELAHFYDQAVSQGKILVAVKIVGASEEKIACAEAILAMRGVQTTELEEG